MMRRAAALVMIVSATVCAFGASAADGRKAPARKTATVASAAAVPVAPAAAPATASVPDETPACARKVKVVYAGYGEADRASCSASASLPVKSAAGKEASTATVLR